MNVTVKEALAAIDTYGQEWSQAETLVDGFLDGVETYAKSAGLSQDETNRLWGGLCTFADSLPAADSQTKTAETVTEQVPGVATEDGTEKAPDKSFLQRAINWLKTTFSPAFKQQGLQGVLGGAALGGLAGAGYTMGSPSQGRSRPWFRNMLIGSLLGAVGQPLWQRYGAPNFQQAAAPSAASPEPAATTPVVEPSASVAPAAPDSYI